jgi:hypothetical protein
MDRDRVHRFHGTSAADWIARVPNELEVDAVGLWQIIPAGRHGFGFSGADLEQFTREALSELLARGALPVTGQDGVWVIEHRYGAKADEIIDNVVKKWLSEGMRDPDVGDVWFGLAAFLAN